MFKEKILPELKIYFNGFLHSYSQIFFSQDKIFAVLLLAVSFFDFGAGFCGILAIIVSQFAAALFSFNKSLIYDGKYTYNSLLVGIEIGLFNEFNYSLVLLTVFASLLTFFITVVINKKFYEKGLPIMSIPFLIVIWIIMLGANKFSALDLKFDDANTLINIYPQAFQWTNDLVDKLPFADIIHIYLRSMGAIMFQYNDLTGLILTIGLIYFSRIGFVSSIYGFLVGYLFYKLFGGDFSQLIYSYIGYNFIITSLALGGFYLIANKRVFLLILFTIPIIALLISGLNEIFTTQP